MQVLDDRTQVILKQAEKTNGRVNNIEAVPNLYCAVDKSTVPSAVTVWPIELLSVNVVDPFVPSP
jgi:hypothetical protein